MRYARVGDAVWYTKGGLHEKAEILALEPATQAVVLPLTGPQRGKPADAPKGTLEPLVIRETCREYEIEVRVRVDKGFFADRGFIRKTEYPSSEISFASGERHPTPEAALEAGLAFARRKIDGRALIDDSRPGSGSLWSRLEFLPWLMRSNFRRVTSRQCCTTWRSSLQR